MGKVIINIKNIGVLYKPNGDKYVGEWIKGDFNGNGILLWIQQEHAIIVMEIGMKVIGQIMKCTEQVLL